MSHKSLSTGMVHIPSEDHGKCVCVKWDPDDPLKISEDTILIVQDTMDEVHEEMKRLGFTGPEYFTYAIPILNEEEVL